MGRLNSSCPTIRPDTSWARCRSRRSRNDALAAAKRLKGQRASLAPARGPPANPAQPCPRFTGRAAVSLVEHGPAPVAAAAVGAHPLAVRELDAHKLAAARAVLHRTEADLDGQADREIVLHPAERHQLRGRAAL